MKPIARELLRDLLFLAGAGLFATGLWWLLPALALLFLGGLLIAAAVYTFLRGDRQ